MGNRNTPTTNRRYGRAHRTERQAWAPTVATGTVHCWRCDEPINPDEPWDLGHRDNQPSHPEHTHCNRSDGGQRNPPSWWH